MHDKEKELISQGYKKYDVYMRRQMSHEILEDFFKEHENFTNIEIINLSCRYHPEYKIFYRILH